MYREECRAIENAQFEAFKKEYASRIEKIGSRRLVFNKEEAWMYAEPYDYIERYAFENRMINTLTALPVVRAVHDGQYKDATIRKDGVEYRLPYVNHCLSVCRTLMNYQIPLDHDDMDVILASALTHDLPLVIADNRLKYAMEDIFQLDHEVYYIVKMMAKKELLIPENEQKAFIERVRQDKRALLVRLVDRSNIIEHLHKVSVWRAKEYIQNTRMVYLPLCIYGIIHYPENANIFSLLMEKLRVLIEASEILIDRFEKRELELAGEILHLEEENAWMKDVLRSAGEEI